MSPRELAYREVLKRGPQTAAARELLSVLDRLDLHRRVHAIRPATKLAARQLELEGLVRITPGEGKDAGIWIVERAWAPVAPVGGGGRAA